MKSYIKQTRIMLAAAMAAVIALMTLLQCAEMGFEYDNPFDERGYRPATPTITTFVDSRDGKSYGKVTIGKQVWMAENLNYNTSGSVCYKNSPDSCAKYGRLYKWATARSVCPRGYHLPNDAEWLILRGYTGGRKLKSTSGWDNNGTNDYGFSALPGSHGNERGGFDIWNAGEGFWWSATEYDASNASNMYIGKDDIVGSLSSGDGNGQFWDGINKENSLSVRCVQD